jgi:hypothetical protein
MITAVYIIAILTAGAAVYIISDAVSDLDVADRCTDVAVSADSCTGFAVASQRCKVISDVRLYSS